VAADVVGEKRHGAGSLQPRTHQPQVPPRADRIPVRPVVADPDRHQEESVEIGEDWRLRRRHAKERRESIRRQQQEDADGRVINAGDRRDRPDK
jgi:hypothetical protein